MRGDGATKATSSEVDALSVPVITARATGTGGTAGFTNTVLRVETVKTGADGTGDEFYLVQVGGAGARAVLGGLRKRCA